ncbi:MAG: hypothetical protein J2P30_00085 [Actinobacteria bacterium]|nr:hypothetical protein [Actinomycetota bacterium]
MANTIGSGDKTDFDETRRLLYMALLVPRTKRYNLAGTLVNALKHHHAVDDLDADEIADHVIRAIEANEDGYGESRNWLRQQIGRITAELGD